MHFSHSRAPYSFQRKLEQKQDQVPGSACISNDLLKLAGRGVHYPSFLTAQFFFESFLQNGVNDGLLPVAIWLIS